jgi:hypothetical protein
MSIYTSKRGPGALRHALYLAVFVAVRCAPEWRVRYERLLARGRAKEEALTILARALLRVVYHLLRTGEAYDAAGPAQPAVAGDDGLTSQYELFFLARFLFVARRARAHETDARRGRARQATSGRPCYLTRAHYPVV